MSKPPEPTPARLRADLAEAERIAKHAAAKRDSWSRIALMASALVDRLRAELASTKGAKR